MAADITGRLRGLVWSASALIAGVCALLVAEVLIARLLTHAHEAAHGTPAGLPHVHNQALASALLIGCLLLASTGAAAVAARRRHATRPVVLSASGLSIVSFLVGHTVVYGAGSLARTWPLLLAGAAIHAGVGACAGLLWRRWLDGVRLPVQRPVAAPAARPPHSTARHPAPLRPLWWTASVLGRAPPLRQV
ncbi:hypothetical protein ACFO1B_23350 [Dactylosporangium siamense]|uniref:Uncharacterized protein n=1 Tax=Dactylosporangium siamense TaxID=685454 RepID=A0A919PP19_9ACTN|nr:hypothetical protein [Dactylosporangium siamense]GIG47132.1 hypothetical protein Dsi01nite_051730 [Dactylosporangium siamense]